MTVQGAHLVGSIPLSDAEAVFRTLSNRGLIAGNSAAPGAYNVARLSHYRAPKQRRKAPVKTPKRLLPLVEEGLIDEVMRQLMSGKEAVVYVVRCGEEIRCAKVYKEANRRSFRQAVQYTEGRKVKNSRRARAMEKRSRYGRQ